MENLKSKNIIDVNLLFELMFHDIKRGIDFDHLIAKLFEHKSS